MSLNQQFHPLCVAEVRRETPDAVSIVFEIPEALKGAYRFDAGQFLTLKMDIAGEEVHRNYSLCMPPAENEFRIAVKETATGLFSRWANRELKPGDTIDVMPPMGRFTHTCDPARGPNCSGYYVAFAGGSGITPVIALIETVLSTEPKSKFTLFYGNRNTASVIFLERLAALKDEYLDRFQLYHFLEDEEEEIELFNGLLDRAKCDALLSTLADPVLIDEAFICGPGPMMDAAEAALLARGVAPEKIKIERFATGPLSGERLARAEQLSAKAAGIPMQVTLDGRRARVAFDAEKGSILESVRAAGLRAPFACKQGVCATCKARVVKGTVEMKANYALSEEDLAKGYILTCQSVPTSEVTLDYDL
jgi:ring-1,2-phenylacetyl-CoA epoxidase subunit PaaE